MIRYFLGPRFGHARNLGSRYLAHSEKAYTTEIVGWLVDWLDENLTARWRADAEREIVYPYKHLTKRWQPGQTYHYVRYYVYVEFEAEEDALLFVCRWPDVIVPEPEWDQ